MTGVGKTYTMLGNMNSQGEVDSRQPGLVMYVVHDLFRFMKEQSDSSYFRLSFSYLEIYNEQVRDLLQEGEGSRNNLMILHDPVKGTFVNELSGHEITLPE